MAPFSAVARGFSLLVCVYAQYELPTPPSALGGSYPDCPCIDVESDPATRNILTMHRQGNGTFRSVGGSTLPAGYGNAKCIAWDHPSLQGDPRCQLMPTPDYCGDAWCFVNASNCQRNNFESWAFPGLSLSYHTCGSVGFQVRSRRWLYNTTIRVYVPGGYVLDEFSDFKGSNTFLYSMMQFAVPVLKTAGVAPENIVYKSLSEAATEKFPDSNYSACIWDIVIGNLDLCVGDFWDTQARRAFGGIFTSTVTQEHIYFYGTVPETVPLSFGEVIIAPLRPFSVETWVMLMTATVLAGCAFLCFETFEVAENEQQDGPQGCLSRLANLTRFVVDGTYFGFESCASGAPINVEATTLSGKALLVGFSIFITIVLATFTANTASFFVAKAVRKQDIADFKAASTKQVPVCVPPVFSLFFQVLNERYGNGWRTNAWFGTKDECLQKIDSGESMFAIVSELNYLSARRRGASCSTSFLGTPLLTVPTGWFASSAIYQAIGEAITVEKDKGTWEAIFETIFGGEMCPAVGDDSVNDVTQLNPSEMAGPCLILLLFCVFGFFIRLAQFGWRFLRCRSSPPPPQCHREV